MYAGKVVDIKRKTKNLNPEFFFIFFFFEREGCMREGGRAWGGVGRKVRAIIFICVYCITLLHIALSFHQAIPYGFLVIACTSQP